MSATSVAIAVVQHGDCFLIGQRASKQVLGGLWEFPGGKVAEHESPHQCAVRECLEETGLTVEVIDLHSQREFTYDHGAVQLFFYLCRPIDSTPPPRMPFRWVKRAELANYEFPPANAELLRSLVTAHNSAGASC